MENLTTTAEIDPAVSVFYDRTLLVLAQPYLHHARFAQKSTIPTKSSPTIKFRRYSNLALATTPLTEGISPNGKQLAKVDLTATAKAYGDYVTITDIVDLTTEDPVITQAISSLSIQSGKTLDWLMKNILASCASTTTASSGTPTATLLHKTDIDTVVQTLIGQDARMMEPVIPGGSGQGTLPVREAYWGILHTDLVNDIEKVSGFIHSANYANQTPVMKGEWGSTGNVRWLYSTQAHNPTADGGTYYNTMIIGQDAYGETDLSGGNLQSIIKPFGSGNDPLNQRATAGWKTMWCGRILNDNYMHLLLVSNA